MGIATVGRNQASTPGRDKAGTPGALCRHCRQYRPTKWRKGLCNRCSVKPEIRCAYLSESKFASVTSAPREGRLKNIWFLIAEYSNGERTIVHQGKPRTLERIKQHMECPPGVVLVVEQCREY